MSTTGNATRTRRIVPAADAQQQILDAVDELFYREGARSVGVDAVVKRAGVNKMSLYRQFESKDALLLHYLEGRDALFWSKFDASLAKHPDAPRAQLLQLFIDLAERTRKPTYRGCPFVNIAAEFPDPEHPARQAVARNKAQLLKRLSALTRAAGARDSAALARGLALLIEGGYTASQTFEPGHAVLRALPETARILIDAACGD